MLIKIKNKIKAKVEEEGWQDVAIINFEKSLFRLVTVRDAAWRKRNPGGKMAARIPGEENRPGWAKRRDN